MNTTRDQRLATANAALKFFAAGTTLEVRQGAVYVTWQPWNKITVSKRWQCRGGQDFYPTWSNKWGHGGTCCTALSQLVRWIQGKPVLPMSSWQWWCSEQVRLADDKESELLALLREGGYPEHTNCVLCDKPIEGGLDWWNNKGISGPCCSWTTGCRQKGVVA